MRSSDEFLLPRRAPRFITLRRDPTGRGAALRALLVVGALAVAVTVGTWSPEPDSPVSRAGLSPTPAEETGADGGTEPTADAPPVDDRGRVVRRAATPGAAEDPGAIGIPESALRAYRQAAAVLARSDAGCRLPVTLLAAIGKVESGHARGGRVDTRGTTRGAILGPVLDGSPGLAVIPDSDGGRLDFDARWDRAVGPMQFIPGTWARWATDGNGDGIANPHNVWDAAAAAGRYLCAGDRDLSRDADLDAAILGYNRSTEYLRLVRAWLAAYSEGLTEVPDEDGTAGTAGAGEPVRDTVVAQPAPGAPPAPGEPAPTRPGEPTAGRPTQPPGHGSPPSRPTQPTRPAPTAGPTTPGAPPLLPPELTQPLDQLGCVVQDVVGGLLGGLLPLPAPPPPPPGTPALPPCPEQP